MATTDSETVLDVPVQDQGNSAETQKPKQSQWLVTRRMKMFLAIAGVSILVGSLIAWRYYAARETTDNAQVDGYINHCRPRDVLPARRRTRVPAASPPSLRPLSAYALAHLQHHSDNPDGIPTTPLRSPQPLFRSTLPFKSHSAPRPPQTPAASS